MEPGVDSILDTVGGTPVVRLPRVVPPGAAALWAKCEQLEPGGSVKDRIALAMIDAAEAAGQLRPGGTVVEPTSGNTGVGLALVCAARGYRCILTMPADMSIERRALLEAYGAEVVLTDPAAFLTGAIEAARDLVASIDGAFMPSQFDNPENPAAHRSSTAPEIVEAFEAMDGARLDAFVVGVGTGGTITGVGPVLRDRFEGIEIVAVEPTRSPVLSGGSPAVHRIQGIGAGLVPAVLDTAAYDRVVAVEDEAAWEMKGRLAREEGLLVGISSGANVVVAVAEAVRIGEGGAVLTVLCDTGERYFSMEAQFA